MPDQTPFRSVEFWVAVIVALIVKVRTSAQLGWKSVVLTIAVAIGSAWVATDYVSDIAGLPQPVAAALVTLTAEGAMRWLLMALSDPRQMIDLLKYWRKP